MKTDQQYEISDVVLCGGLSKRMGQDKALLPIGTDTFLTHLMKEFSKVNRLYLSLGNNRTYPHAEESGIAFEYIKDIYNGCGPLGGLHAIATSIPTEWFFVTTTDLPFVDRGLKNDLQSYISGGIDAVIPVEDNGRLHPLCGIYRSSLADVLKVQLESENYKVRDFLKRIRVCYVPVHKLSGGSYKLLNINTPKDYEDHITRGRYINYDRPIRVKRNVKGIPMISIAAYSGTGKTQFLEGLISSLKKRDFKVAVLKHDGHDFQIDKEGKDTWRFAKAGADPVMICSGSKAARMDYHPLSAEEMLNGVSDVDLILIEGYKNGPYPKILLYRKGANRPVAVDLKIEQPVLIVSDTKDWKEAVCPVIDINDISGACDFLIQYIRSNLYYDN